MRENMFLHKIEKESTGVDLGVRSALRARRRPGEKPLERKFTAAAYPPSTIDARMQFTSALFREQRYGVQVTGYVIEPSSLSLRSVRRFRFSRGRNFDSGGPGCKNDIHALWDSPWWFPRWHSPVPNRRITSGSESSSRIARRDIGFAW